MKINVYNCFIIFTHAQRSIKELTLIDRKLKRPKGWFPGQGVN